MQIINLGNGYVTKVDDADYDFLNQWKWHVSKNRYVRRTEITDKTGGVYTYKKIMMHRLLMNPPDGMVVDHINGDGFDNQRSNLRICTLAENVRNSRVNSKRNMYKGVYPTRYNTYRATIRKGDEFISLGCYDTKELAAEAYNCAAIEHFGEFANLNEVVYAS